MFDLDAADPIEVIRAGIERLAAEDRSGWSGVARSQRVGELLEVSDRLAAETFRCVGQWDAGLDWAEDGASSASAWLAHRAPVAKMRANQVVRAARLAFRYERTGKALGAGDASAAHVEVLAAAIRGRERLFGRDEDTLLDIAPTLSVDEFTTVVKYWRSAADDELSRLDALHAFETRFVSLASTFGGRVELRGSFDAEGGEIVADALAAYDRPDPVGVEGMAPRTLGQRYADAMVQICSEALHGREDAGHPTTTADVVLDLGTLTGDPPHDLSEVRCELSGVGPVAPAVALRMACDAAVSRVLMSGKSEVLDLGRRTPVVSRAIRRAVVLRDRHCSFPGCNAPSHWCDVHHCTHWVDGGETSVQNCVLLCRRHHVLVHEGGWRIARAPDGTVEVIERGRRMRVRARGPGGSRGP